MLDGGASLQEICPPVVWLDDGFSATITVTIDGTTTSANVIVTWVEVEEEADDTAV